MGVLRHRGPLGSQVPTPETPPLGQALEQLRIPSSGRMLGLGDVHGSCWPRAWETVAQS